jgi:flagellar secretion chaperone FliS
MKKKMTTYDEVDTLGSTQVELILKVYNGALSALQSARAHYEKSEWPQGYEQLEQARKFVVHLYSTLNFEQGGEIAQNLGKLYVYLLSEVDAVEATKNLAHLDSCLTVLNNLKAGWDGIKQTVSADSTGRRSMETSGTVTAGAPFLVEA